MKNNTEQKGTLLPLEHLMKSLPIVSRLMAIDMSKNALGFALSNEEKTLALPYEKIKRTKFKTDIITIKNIIAHEKIKAIIIGMPFNMDGTNGPRAQSVRAFQREIEQHIPLPMAFMDERLTTYEAEKLLEQTSLKAKQRNKNIDSLAAAIILQSALNTYV